MLLSDLLSKLSYNELANTAVGSKGSGVIAPDSLGRVISAINDALLDLFTRFNVSTKELIVQSYDYKSIYPLKQVNALSDPTDGYLKYIIDTPDDPFIGDIIMITGVRNEVGSCLPVNDPEQWASVFTPQTDVLQLTHVSDNQAFFVEYRARHKIINYDPDNPSDFLQQEIDIPTSLEQALRYKVCSTIFLSISGQENSAKAQELSMLYDNKCNEIDQLGLMGYSEIPTNVKLYRRGFI